MWGDSLNQAISIVDCSLFPASVIAFLGILAELNKIDF